MFDEFKDEGGMEDLWDIVAGVLMALLFIAVVWFCFASMP